VTRYGDVEEVSNSEVQSYLDCKRRWWLSYYRALTPVAEKQVGPMAVGRRVHRVLEEGYSTPGREEAARRILAETIERDYPLAEEAGDLKKFESEAELALIMVEGFFDWAAEEGLDAEWEVVAPERIVKAPPIEVLGRPVIVKGKLDQLIRRLMDGSLFMRDWKTTVEFNPVMMSFKPQLKTYLLILSLTEPDAQVSGGQFVFLRRVKRSGTAKPPFYYVEPIFVGPREMENFYKQLTGTLARMMATVDALDAGADHHQVVPPRPTRDCSWRCPFYACCDMFDDGSNVEQYLEITYKRGDPYAYYGMDDKDKETE
jgi:CRISPR/Cas system-associated exonuclease Cas4 (RecB family)